LVRVAVPAAAGSSPVAHPSEVPANSDIAREADRSVLRDGDTTGTVSQEATAGTPADPGGDEPPIRFLGDEPELYLEFNHELVKTLSAHVRASREDIDDAASFAWIQFFRYQPDRDREWKGWLYRTAQREAWRLNAEHGRANLRIVADRESREQRATREPLDPRDRLEERLEFLAAMEEVRRLPRNLRAVALRGAHFDRHRDVAEALWVSTARVTHLLPHVGVYLQERMQRRAELERPVASPRATRLLELELEPPAWLVEAIGRPPRFNKSSARPVLAWRRAALAIDRYRHEAGWHSKKSASVRRRCSRTRGARTNTHVKRYGS
jgi:hypothetical protein